MLRQYKYIQYRVHLDFSSCPECEAPLGSSPGLVEGSRSVVVVTAWIPAVLGHQAEHPAHQESRFSPKTGSTKPNTGIIQTTTETS